MNIWQCYDILEIGYGASPAEVKRAYRELASVWHPDRITSDNPRLKNIAEERMKDINLAYEMLIPVVVSQKRDRPRKKSEPENTTQRAQEYAENLWNEWAYKAAREKEEEAKSAHGQRKRFVSLVLLLLWLAVTYSALFLELDASISGYVKGVAFFFNFILSVYLFFTLPRKLAAFIADKFVDFLF